MEAGVGDDFQSQFEIITPFLDGPELSGHDPSDEVLRTQRLLRRHTIGGETVNTYNEYSVDLKVLTNINQYKT
jgi:hypothetical protein